LGLNGEWWWTECPWLHTNAAQSADEIISQLDNFNDLEQIPQQFGTCRLVVRSRPQMWCHPAAVWSHLQTDMSERAWTRTRDNLVMQGQVLRQRQRTIGKWVQ
jgi:hypothetical protein